MKWQSPIAPLPKNVQRIIREKHSAHARCQVQLRPIWYRPAGGECKFRAQYIVDGKRMCGRHYQAMQARLARPPADVTAPQLRRELEAANIELQRLQALINTPELHEFGAAITREAAHQRERWGADHDTAKSPEDWLWVIAFLATKAVQAARYGDRDKYLHHIITCAATCANWHARAMAELTDSAERIGGA